jgi:hypothetical protein
VCVLGISDLTTASAYDVAVGMEHGRISARVCVNNTNDNVWSSVNPRVSSICRCTLKTLACSVCGVTCRWQVGLFSSDDL